jgi:hypothetical protein
MDDHRDQRGLHIRRPRARQVRIELLCSCRIAIAALFYLNVIAQRRRSANEREDLCCHIVEPEPLFRRDLRAPDSKWECAPLQFFPQLYKSTMGRETRIERMVFLPMK